MGTVPLCIPFKRLRGLLASESRSMDRDDRIFFFSEELGEFLAFFGLSMSKEEF
jgi:hypothetical protein